ncbi:MAG TPA: hypothetical protein VGD65_14630 [Chryseosolibacter sp.]
MQRNELTCSMLGKLKFSLGIFLLLSASGWASSDHATFTRPKSHCIGYSIIEFGKGVDCDGDTIRLMRANGFQQHLAESQPNKTTLP